MTDHLLNLHGDVLAAMRRGPKHFAKLAFVLSEADEPADTDLSHFRDRIVAAGPGDELTALWHRTLTAWDLAEQADWSAAPPRTDERRAGHVQPPRLRRRPAQGARRMPSRSSRSPVPTVISKEFTSWYSRDTRGGRSFYWNSYEQTPAPQGLVGRGGLQPRRGEPRRGRAPLRPHPRPRRTARAAWSSATSRAARPPTSPASPPRPSTPATAWSSSSAAP